MPIARAEINGIAGSFLIDTGASFVTLSPSFAAKAKPTYIKAGPVELQTANGNANGTLATVDLITLSGLSAAGVPTVVASKQLGDGIDGLLGMSFLSRFTILLEDEQLSLTARALKTDQ